MELQNIIGIILGILVCICLTVIVCIYIRVKKYKEEYIEKRKKEFDAALTKEAKALETAIYNRQFAQKNFEEWKEQEIKHIQEREEVAKKYVDSLEEQKKVRLQAEEDAREQGKFNLDNLLQRYFNKEYNEYADQLQEVKENLLASAENEFYNTCASLNSDIASLRAELDEYRKKRDAINEEIRREEELKLQQDAHRIILSDNDKNDIKYLISILDNLRNKELVYKLIWSEYLIKPFQNMIKTMFGNKVPSNVIYCIESLDGRLKYIGKTSADVSKRWTEHIKTSLNIGTVSRSKLHDVLFLHWDEYVFSILEIVPKDQLSIREKYYISFFESDKYGLNMKQGG